MKLAITLAAALAVSGCGLRTADYADSATTAIAIAQGATELNPIVGALGDNMAAPVSLALTAGARYAIDEYADEQNQDRYHRGLTNAKWFASCNNFSVILWTAGIINPLTTAQSLFIGTGCGVASWYFSQDTAQ